METEFKTEFIKSMDNLFEDFEWNIDFNFDFFNIKKIFRWNW